MGIMENKLYNLIESKLILKEMADKGLLSEGMRYHIDNKIPMSENIYRPLSKKFMNLFKECRELYNEGAYIPKNNFEEFLLKETSIGEVGIYKGKKVALDFPMECKESINEAEYKGKKVELNKPKRGGSKKFYVYVKDPKTGNVKKVSFGSKEMPLNIADPEARKSFVARHKCKEKKDKTSAGYWACRIGRYPHLFNSKSKYTWW